MEYTYKTKENSKDIKSIKNPTLIKDIEKTMNRIAKIDINIQRLMNK